MTDMPQIDLAAESAVAGWEITLVGLVLLAALAFLFRGVLRRRRGAAPACSGCGGCASGDICHVVDYDFGVDPGRHTGPAQGRGGSQGGS